jgi:DNA-binding transcriptional MerR regulator
MHIELSKDKRYYSIGEVAKAFDVNASLIRFDNEFDILKPKKECKRQSNVYARGHHQLTIDLSLVKERGFTLEGAKPI